LERRKMIEQDRFDSPADLAARLDMDEPAPPALILLSGASGAGKTTWMLGLLEEVKLRCTSAAGLISPLVYSDGIKIAVDCLDVYSDRRWRLAERQNASSPGSHGIHTRDWVFDPAVFARAGAILETQPVCPALLVDELGPLEFDQGVGFLPAFARIEARQYRLGVVVIRPALLERARQRWPWGRAYFVEAGSARLAGG
jgi:nucleoside-triphosphatase THEP1